MKNEGAGALCRHYGVPSVARLSRDSGVNVDTLFDWYHHRRRCFEMLCKGWSVYGPFEESLPFLIEYIKSKKREDPKAWDALRGWDQHRP